MNIKNIFSVLAILFIFNGCTCYEKNLPTEDKEKVEQEKQPKSEVETLTPIIPEEKVSTPPTSNEKEREEITEETTEEIKIKILKGEIPIDFTKERVKELFQDPYVVYSSDTEIMEVWFYKDFAVGFNEKGVVIKVFNDEITLQKLTQDN